MIVKNRSSMDGPFQDDGPSDEEKRAAFARIFAQNDRWLYAYLMTLLGKPAYVEEVFQEVCVVLWREYEKFDPSTHFMKWAAVIALNQVRKFRRNMRKQDAWLSDTALELLAEEAIGKVDLLESRRHALHNCIAQLAPSDQELVRSCYNDQNSSIKEAASAVGRPLNTVYKALSRIRRALHGCIDRQVSTEELS